MVMREWLEEKQMLLGMLVILVSAIACSIAPVFF